MISFLVLAASVSFVFYFIDFFYRLLLSLVVVYLIASLVAMVYMMFCMVTNSHPTVGYKVMTKSLMTKIKEKFTWKRKKAVAPDVTAAPV